MESGHRRACTGWMGQGTEGREQQNSSNRTVAVTAAHTSRAIPGLFHGQSHTASGEGRIKLEMTEKRQKEGGQWIERYKRPGGCSWKRRDDGGRKKIG